MSDCITCELVERRDRGDAPAWDSILRTDDWDVVHAFGTSVEGWLVLVTRRHVAALADMTDDEAAELGPLIKRVSAALHEVVGCEKTYAVQLAEGEGHHHVHVHLIPRAPDQPEDRRGIWAFADLGVAEADEVPESRRNEIAGEISEILDAG